MNLYSARHGFRSEKEKTYDVSIEAYSLLFDCCQRYLICLAWKFPVECQDGRGICNYDSEKLDVDLRYEIPDLFRRDGMIDKPRKWNNVFDGQHQDEFSPYAIFDYIEYIAYYAKDYNKGDYHGFFGHYHYTFKDSKKKANEFCDEIEDIFEKTGLLYRINEKSEIERKLLNSPLSEENEKIIEKVSEEGLRELLLEAISLYKRPNPSSIKDATEKIWDAFERMKTFYTDLDKKDSANKVIQNASSGNADFGTMLKEEFKALTTIGNTYRIRHHETDRIEITEFDHYEYFFNRCLSLITLTIKYLEK